MFVVGEGGDSGFHIVGEFAHGDGAVFVGVGAFLAVQGFEHGVGEQAVLLLAAFEGVFGSSRGTQDRGAAAATEVHEDTLEAVIPFAFAASAFDGLDGHASRTCGEHGHDLARVGLGAG